MKSLPGPVLLAGILVVVQPVLYYAVPKSELVPEIRPLKEFPDQIAGWDKIQEGVIEQEVQDLLKADDTLSRSYLAPDKSVAAGLFVAFFKTQRAGVSPHSPKVCLPGSGWVPINDASISIPVAGRQEPIVINRYTIARGDAKSVVLYWYQSRDRVVANEYAAKLYLMADAIRYRRSDTSLVRVIVPVEPNSSEEVAENTARKFVQEIFQPISNHLATNIT